MLQFPTPPRPSARRWFVHALLAAAVVATGCASSTQPATQYDKRPGQPLPVSSLRVVFIETDYKLTGERPWLTAAQVNEQRAMLGTAFRAEFPQAMKAAGVTAHVRAFGDKVEMQSPEMRQWLGSAPATSHLLFVRPSGGKVHCTGGPCNFRFGVEMRLFAASSPQPVWSATLQQPDLTPSLTIGQAADYAHFSREMARVLLQDTTARPRP
jgi:hypothetical protein